MMLRLFAEIPPLHRLHLRELDLCFARLLLHQVPSTLENESRGGGGKSDLKGEVLCTKMDLWWRRRPTPLQHHFLTN
ncbi:MAG: hypothetical protein ACKO96_07955, partial [Flammeovirgaceae bacterium]